MKKGNTMKRVLSLIMAFAMLLTLMPTAALATETDGTKTIYLDPGVWSADGAWFAAWVWGSSSTADAWYKLSDTDSDSVYEAEVPADSTDIKFVRKNPASSTLDWNDIWDDSGDQTISGNCYTVKGWDVAGSWSTYTPSTTTAPSEEASEPKDDTVTYIIAGNSTVLFGTEWDTTNTNNAMTLNASGLYEKTYTNVPVGTYEFKVTDGTWDNAWGNGTNNYSVTVDKDGSTLTITFDATSGTVNATVTPPASTEEPDDSENETTVYLVPNTNWKDASARFAVYYFDDAAGTNGWISMTDADSDGYYEAVVPAGYSTLIFCRMDPSTTENNWDNKWNQTGNLTLDGTNNCYTITEGSWDAGTWSVYTPTTGGDTDADEATYILAGSAAIFGTEWDIANTSNKMALNAETGLYEKTYESVPVGTYEFKVTDGTWNNSWGKDGGNYSFTIEAISDVTITFNADTKAITVTTEATGEVAEPVENVTIHYRNTGLWSSVYYHAWIENGDNDTGLTTWPGETLTENAEYKNWYTLTLTELDAANGIGVLFNSGDGSQTEDIAITKSGEYWYDGELLTEAPTGTWPDGSVETVTYEATFHFANALNWSSVYLYTWTATGNPNGGWPGTKTGLDTDGFYSLNFTYEAPEGQGLNFIFSNGNGTQTVDLALKASDFTDNKTEKWVVPTTTDSEGKYFCDIVEAAEAIAISPVVDDTSVTFEYKNADASAVYVAGTMNGWSTTATPMTKNAYGVWSVTVKDLSYGIHQYKFVVDGNWITDPLNSWTEDGNSAFLISDPDKDTNKVTINIHYTRADGAYDNWNAHVWTLDMAEQYDFTAEEGAGMITTIEVDGRHTQAVNFIVRKSEGTNLWVEQLAQQQVNLANIVSGTIDVYMNVDASGNLTVTQKLSDDVVTTNKISSVELDYDNNTIIIQTAKTVADPETAFGIINTEDETETVAIASVEEEDSVAINGVTASGSTYTLTPNKELDLVTLYQYKILFNEQKAYTDYQYDIGITTVYASEKFGNEFTYTGSDLGATWTSGSTAFRLWAPTAEAVEINLYKSGTAGTDDLIKQVEMTASDNGTWIATVDGDQNGTYYTYSVTRNGETVEAVDPYARTTGVNGKRGMVINLDSTDPSGWSSDTDPNPLSSYTDAIIYELHVRDFSIDSSSGMTNKGKFLALTETGTKTSNGTTTGLDYLKSLGITHLHLLPVYDYGSVDETTCSTFNWGYDPVNYNVPEGSYSTDPYSGEVRVEEFKEMVSTLHDNGISVIMDVVYNHVYDAGAFCMNQIVPGYFSRQNSDGSYSNGSGCGNDTASEREMVRKYIVDSVKYWADEYHVDGFRFDLVGLLDATTINEIVNTVHENHPGALFYGEGWTLGTAVEPGNTMATQANSSATPKFAYFSDTMRNLLAGNNGKSVGFVSGLTGQEEAVANNFMASPWWSTNPTQIVQYASCHDNYTLVDKLVLSTGASGVTSDIIKMNNLAAAIYMTSQGIPFIHAGEEFLREKLNGSTRVENSYNASDAVNSIKWSNLDGDTYAANSAYYKGLIAFRKAHPALRLTTNAAVKANVTYTWITNEVVMFTIDGTSVNDSADTIVVIFNANSTAKTVSLPEGEWKVCINGEKAGTAALSTASGSVSVAGISAMVLTQGEPEEEELVDFAGATMTLGNSLAMNFVIDTSALEGDGHYAVVTKEYADGRENAVVTINQADWKVYSGDLYYFTFNDIAAKEMTDKLSVVVYNSEGTAVTNVREDSVRDYGMRAIKDEEQETTPDTEKLALYVDMLNYGAAAQEYFDGYHSDDLANSQLTDEQKAYATAEVTMENEQVKGDGYAGSTLTLKSEIQLNFVFAKSTVTEDMYAVATYTDHYGKAKSITIEGKDFVEYNSANWYIPVTGMAVADCSQLVTCTIYNADKTVVTSAYDSVESYVARGSTDVALYSMIMKFAASAYASFH